MPEVDVTNNSGSLEVITDPEGGEIGAIKDGKTKTFHMTASEFSRIKDQLKKLVNNGNYTVTLVDEIDDEDDIGQ